MLGAFNNGLAPALEIKSKKAGFTDESGNFKIPATFYAAHGFRDGLAVVPTDRLTRGCIDPTGKLGAFEPVVSRVRMPPKQFWLCYAEISQSHA